MKKIELVRHCLTNSQFGVFDERRTLLIGRNVFPSDQSSVSIRKPKQIVVKRIRLICVIFIKR